MDYQVGKTMFRAVMTMKKARELPDSTPVPGLDSAVDDLMVNHDYLSTAGRLAKAHGSPSKSFETGSETPKEFVFNAIGTLCRQKTAADLGALVNTILLDEAPAKTAPAAESAATEVWKYTSLLWERGQFLCKNPEVKEDQMPGLPTRFMATITFGGVTGSGVASTKKEAKHLASKSVCDQLEISP